MVLARTNCAASSSRSSYRRRRALPFFCCPCRCFETYSHWRVRGRQAFSGERSGSAHGPRGRTEGGLGGPRLGGDGALARGVAALLRSDALRLGLEPLRVVALERNALQQEHTGSNLMMGDAVEEAQSCADRAAHGPEERLVSFPRHGGRRAWPRSSSRIHPATLSRKYLTRIRWMAGPECDRILTRNPQCYKPRRLCTRLPLCAEAAGTGELTRTSLCNSVCAGRKRGPPGVPQVTCRG